ncbi:expressed unknown protein [Seminavis robusta]|uniref:Uncharacterized protein n=1 Tax=Seminavis robusta TaxID=568900 RepID=A0A9N8H5T8_9STRA|nr:expressed unknown protein [Seminavis robusta]|eukprot:Sro95_g049180.1 n/a (938) ;mRNA; f:19444-22552
MLQRLFESLRDEEAQLKLEDQEQDDIGIAATGSRPTADLAETVLLDASEEDYDAHMTPFFASRGNTPTPPTHDKLQGGDTACSSVSTGTMEMELQLQMQMEQASLARSVDSQQYEYRLPNGNQGNADLLGSKRYSYTPNPLLQDPALDQHLRDSARSFSMLHAMEEEVSLTSDLSVSMRSTPSQQIPDDSLRSTNTNNSTNQDQTLPPPPPLQVARELVVVPPVPKPMTMSNTSETKQRSVRFAPLEVVLDSPHTTPTASDTTTSDDDEDETTVRSGAVGMRVPVNGNDDENRDDDDEELGNTNGWDTVGEFGLSDALQSFQCQPVNSVDVDDFEQQAEEMNSEEPLDNSLVLTNHEDDGDNLFDQVQEAVPLDTSLVTNDGDSSANDDDDDDGVLDKKLDMSDATHTTFLLEDDDDDDAEQDMEDEQTETNNDDSEWEDEPEDEEEGQVTDTTMRERLLALFPWLRKRGFVLDDDASLESSRLRDEEVVVPPAADVNSISARKDMTLLPMHGATADTWTDDRNETSMDDFAMKSCCRFTFCQMLVVAFVIAVATTVTTLLWETRKSSPNPQGAKPLHPPMAVTDMCNSDVDEIKEGKLDLTITNVPFDQVYAKQRELETLFQMAYNDASGMCEGPYERVLQEAFIRDIASDGSSMIQIGWAAMASCNGCPDYEPLFAREFGVDGRQFLLKFYDFFNRYLPGVLDAPESQIVFMASITIDNGEADQVIDFLPRQTQVPSPPTAPVPTEVPTPMFSSHPTEAPSVASPSSVPTGKPSSLPTLSPSSSPTEAKRQAIFDIVPVSPTSSPTAENSVGTITNLALWDLSRNAVVEGYENLQDGFVLQRSLLPTSFTFMAETSSEETDGVHFRIYGDDKVKIMHAAVEKPYTFSIDPSLGARWNFDPSETTYLVEARSFVYDWDEGLPIVGSRRILEFHITE